MNPETVETHAAKERRVRRNKRKAGRPKRAATQKAILKSDVLCRAAEKCATRERAAAVRHDLISEKRSGQ